ncbi:hypothetical protein GGU10DRAFT_134493 [Lentinula aff. detonsa]|uniref:Uncharacterized protein n=1 Tax=Lentinula aff. detonsa TaxID=2804958 RepID=A0AA38NHI5_9AGAR|nr:hypothetical protein GGU10DRAFT_134493 [Lentinula aff. detonsa]
MRLLLTLAANTVIFIIFWCLSFTFAADPNAGAGPQNGTHQELICIPFGECEPCPLDELDKPFCQPFGNRRLMHCHNASFQSSSYYDGSYRPPRPRMLPPDRQHNPIPNLNSNSDHDSNSPHRPLDKIGETPAWESCGRIISRERADFYEFMACNVLFAIGAILVVYIRSRRLHALHARQLAARIGLIRNGGAR